MPASPPKPAARTLGELRASGWQSRSVKVEIRDNLIAALREKRPLFPGILGYEETVLPQVQTALLARHNILLLGLRGQAKTRVAREMTQLLDPWLPIVAGSELNDDPTAPLSRYARDLIAEKGDATPIDWVPRHARYTEKLATPDVTVADLIGDLDPIKAANQNLSYADERAIHFGLIPRANRGLFVINELPDLQPRIQVALFNILQEGDMQIRGFTLRLRPDILFVFTANPEDYTNRGSIVTPLKDRIQSQILTHYPRSLATGVQITLQEADLTLAQRKGIEVSPLIHNLVEQIAISARESELIDQKSGVSARLSISAYEALVSGVELRLLHTGEKTGRARIGDLYSALPAITGKVELVYEGEQEGPQNVALSLISRAIRAQFVQLFPDPEKLKRKRKEERTESPYQAILDWFMGGNTVDLLRDTPEQDYAALLDSVRGLRKVVQAHAKNLTPHEELLLMEFVLHGLAETSQLNKHQLERGVSFKDMLGGLVGNFRLEDFDTEED